MLLQIRIAKMSDLESAKELIQMCRTGRLYEIQRWISEGKSIDIAVASKRRRPESLLELAVETGFHSLVELIAKNEQGADAKTAALCAAVSARRMDLIEVLCANGAEPKTVPLDTVTTCSLRVRWLLFRPSPPLVFILSSVPPRAP